VRLGNWHRLIVGAGRVERWDFAVLGSPEPVRLLVRE
jgi:hypothetical protein